MDNVRYLIDLFESIDVTEKGIEKVYDYLLNHKVIEDPKLLQKDLDIGSFQRVYKILKVLKDLDLVQTYGRPMKSILNSPVKTWQKIISNKIKEIQQESTQKIKVCENSFQNMIEGYNLEIEEPELPPVEFINITENEDPIDIITKDFFGDCSEIRIAKDLNFEISFLKPLYNQLKEPNTSFDSILYLNLIKFFQTQMKKVKFQVLISSEYFQELLPKFTLLVKQFRKIPNEISSKISSTGSRFDFRIHKAAVGNFVVKEQKELLQYSINPSNFLIGIFVSRQCEIVEIFSNKFDEKFEEALNFDEQCKELEIGPFSDYEKGLLFLI